MIQAVATSTHTMHTIIGASTAQWSSRFVCALPLRLITHIRVYYTHIVSRVCGNFL